jgi:two-component system, cell cycle sensor histidine kinase and response regulator CckA
MMPAEASMPRRGKGTVVLDRRRPSPARDAQLARLETVGELSAAFVHDFNNLLTVIAGYAELLATELEPGPTREAAHQIRLAADRAADVSARLLQFVQPTASVGTSGVLDAGATVASLRLLATRLAGADHPVILKLDRRPLPLRMDARDLELAVLNLIINARHASPPGSPLVIGAERGTSPDGPVATVFVADRGPGVPPGLRERVFEPFFTTRAEQGGTGLGLAIVQRTAQRWNGEARVRAHRGGGARFELRFPLAED